MIDLDRVDELLDRIETTKWQSLSANIRAFFSYLEKELPANNPTFVQFEEERKTKWEKWGPGHKPGHGRHSWDFPEDSEEWPSLAWDLFKTIAQDQHKGDNFLIAMYGHNHLPENTEDFLDEWLPKLKDGLKFIFQNESTGQTSDREKEQKFGILDSQNQLEIDSEHSTGLLGVAMLFMDIDNFKELNSDHNESKVDDNILVPLRKLLLRCVDSVGYAYGVGGDEFCVFLPNMSQSMAVEFSKALQIKVLEMTFPTLDKSLRISMTIGVAHDPDSSQDGKSLKERANEAENYGKKAVKGRVYLWLNGEVKET